jgi:hypothetical protein
MSALRIYINLAKCASLFHISGSARQQQNEHIKHTRRRLKNIMRNLWGTTRTAAKYTRIYFGTERERERTVIAMNSDLLFIATPFVSRRGGGGVTAAGDGSGARAFTIPKIIYFSSRTHTHEHHAESNNQAGQGWKKCAHSFSFGAKE